MTLRALASYHSRMLAELDHLAGRVGQLASLAHDLREENHSLRASLAEKLSETGALQARLDAARMRIEGLLTVLPPEGSA